jgi:hypothetical protein
MNWSFLLDKCKNFLLIGGGLLSKKKHIFLFEILNKFLE